jgi:uncharacterized NAD-dependent epimerase/dehydratase family protein
VTTPEATLRDDAPLTASATATSAAAALRDHHRIVLLTDGFSTPFLAKTAISLLRYRTDDVVALLDATVHQKTTGQLLGVGGDLPVVASLAEVSQADSLYIGIAPPGGKLPTSWRSIILEALRRGMDVVSGLHDFLSDDEEYVRLAEANRCHLVDVRRNRFKSTASNRQFRPGSVRIHTVGHDCSIGKMVASVEVQLALVAAGHDAKFLATGQTGIMISGEGVPVDCVVSDFVNGAAEQLVADNEAHDYLLIEGQGSLTHPAFSAVTLGLLHGSAPDALIFCYEAGRKFVKGLDGVAIPDLSRQLAFFLTAANFRHPCRLIGVAINTRTLSPQQAAEEVALAERTFGVPACDVYRDGADKLVQATISLRERILAQNAAAAAPIEEPQ